MTKEEAKKEITKLVKKFNDNISYYQRTDYKETPTGTQTGRNVLFFHSFEV